MAKRGAGTRGAAKKKAKASGSKKKAAKKPSKTRAGASRGSPRKPGKGGVAVRVPNAIGLQTQHVDFLTLRLDQVKRFYTEILGFKQFRQEPKLNYLYIRTTGGASLGFMPPTRECWANSRPPGSRPSISWSSTWTVSTRGCSRRGWAFSVRRLKCPGGTG